MRRLLAFACVLALTACGGAGEEATAPSAAAEDPALAPGVTPVPFPQVPGVVADIDPAFLLRATLSRDGRQYRVDRVDGHWQVDGRNAEAKVGAWLERYDPLRADGNMPRLAPDSFIFAPDAQVSFFFSDGSGRVVSFRRLADSLAVVAKPSGPVYRLPADRLDALVPSPEAFTNE